MTTIEALIIKLSHASVGDRRLDSEVVAAALGPPGCVLDPVEGLDGWDIQFAPNVSGEAACWREAADVAPVTTYLDAASELVIEARPKEAAAILARALQQMSLTHRSISGEAMVACMARSIVMELLRTMQAEHEFVAQAA